MTTNLRGETVLAMAAALLVAGWMACAGAAFTGESVFKWALARQEIANYKLMYRNCEAVVREADANRIEHGHCTQVRKPRKREWQWMGR